MRRASVTWLPPEARGWEGPIVGDAIVAGEVGWMAEEDVEMSVTPTGPAIQADIDNPAWALLAILEQFGAEPEVSGDVPELPDASYPDDAVA